ncbi:MAG: hypothetical protein Q7T24_05680, partial [Deltaproteobacteria bacterium]|nr:hypothetical protein [Deltaproteobacteria bacterium]
LPTELSARIERESPSFYDGDSKFLTAFVWFVKRNWLNRLLKNPEFFQAAQKAPDARRREARNEAYFVCTPQ